MSSFLELQNDAYFWLGTNDRNAAFPRAQIKRVLNMVIQSIYEDCVRSFPDAFTSGRTLTADGTDPSSYILANQSPAIRPKLFAEVRITDSEGTLVDEVPFTERWRRSGYLYSLVGNGPSTVLYTGGSVSEGVALYAAVIETITDLSGDSESPSWCPSEFHDVFSLDAAYLASGSGNEQGWSAVLEEKRQDRLAQLRFAMSHRSLSATIARTR